MYSSAYIFWCMMDFLNFLLIMWFFTVTCRVFWHSVTRMGFGMYEGPFVGQSKRQSSDNCAGTCHCLV
jgi:hypothetical protein